LAICPKRTQSREQRLLPNAYMENYANNATWQTTGAENNAYYQTPTWKTMRTMQLGKQPLCQACLCKGIVNTASHIDHLFAWSQLGSHAFYNNILQSLCPECHSSKTALEQQGIYRHYTSDGIKDYAIHDYKQIVSSSPV